MMFRDILQDGIIDGDSHLDLWAPLCPDTSSLVKSHCTPRSLDGKMSRAGDHGSDRVGKELPFSGLLLYN